MKSFVQTLGLGFMTALALLFAAVGIETAGFYFSHLHFSFFELGRSLLMGLIAAAVIALISGVIIRAGKLPGGLAGSLASAISGGLLLFLTAALWLFSGPIASGPPGSRLSAFLLLLVLFIGLGVKLLRPMLSAGGEPARARAFAFAVVAVMATGVYSSVVANFSFPASRASAVLIMILLGLPGYRLLRALGENRRGRIRPALELLIIIVVCALGAAGVLIEHRRLTRPAKAGESFPPVILITIDTLRADLPSPESALSRPGAGSSLPPHLRNPADNSSGSSARILALEDLAGDGIRFSHAMAPSNWTPTSVASILTGLSPSACGAGRLIPGEPEDYTGPLYGSPSLAQVFRDQGYVTAGLVHNAWLTRRRGFARGFTQYEFLEDPGLLPRFLFTRAWARISEPFQKLPAAPCVRLTDRALSWLAARPEGPFFLWVHYIDPHLPYSAHGKYPARTRPGPMTELLVMDPVAMRIRLGYFGLTERDRQFIRERYDGEVLATDDEVGRLLAGLKDLGLYDRSLIVLTSDHGEEFWEHGDFEHGHSFHLEVVEVPLIIKKPGGGHAGEVAEQWVSLTRIGKTILELAGIGSEFPGQSLMPCLTDDNCGDSTIRGRVWISEMTLCGNERGAIGDLEGHKVIFHGDGTLTCYDLSRDPGEQEPLIEGRCSWPPGFPGPRELFKEIGARDQSLYRELLKKSRPQAQASEDEIQKLKDMGYIR